MSASPRTAPFEDVTPPPESPQPCSSQSIRSPEGPATRIEAPEESSPNSEVTLLFDWCPVFFFPDGDCCVAGYILLKGEERLYRSNIVAAVEENGRLMVDKDDKRYRLSGDFCKRTYDEVAKLEDVKTIQEFPLVFKMGFKTGFPVYWKTVISKTVNILLFEDSMESSPKRPPNSQHLPSSSISSIGASKHRRSIGSYVTREEDSSSAKPNNFVFKIVKEDDSDPVIVAADVKEIHLDRLDSGGPVDLKSSLRRTRSGRLVRPPLDNWRGQYLDAEGDSVTVCPGSERDPIYLKRLGLRPKPTEDSGYTSPIQISRKKAVRAPKKDFHSQQLTFTRKKRQQKRKKANTFPVTQLLSSDSETSASGRSSLLRRASIQRIVHNLGEILVSDKSVQMSPQRTRHVGTQTAEEDSGIASGSCSACGWPNVSSAFYGDARTLKVPSDVLMSRENSAPPSQHCPEVSSAPAPYCVPTESHFDNRLYGAPSDRQTAQDRCSSTPQGWPKTSLSGPFCVPRESYFDNRLATEPYNRQMVEGISAPISQRMFKMSSASYCVPREAYIDNHLATGPSHHQIAQESSSSTPHHWPKMSMSAPHCVPRESYFDNQLSTEPCNRQIAQGNFAPASQHGPKMSMTAPCRVSSDQILDRNTCSLLSGPPALLNEAPSALRPLENRNDGRMAAPMTTSTPVQRPSVRRSRSRLEKLWEIQHEIIATMNVDLDADSETSFVHDRF